jgi:hypothetical protein
VKDVRTVGDLRRLIVQLDAEGIPDDMTLARRCKSKNGWSKGFDQVWEIELVTLDLDAASVTVEASDAMIERNFVAVPPFRVLAFD